MAPHHGTYFAAVRCRVCAGEVTANECTHDDLYEKVGEVCAALDALLDAHRKARLQQGYSAEAVEALSEVQAGERAMRV